MSFSVNYLVFCVPTLHINNYRNRDIVLNTLVTEFITLGVKHHMAGKVPKSKDFYKVSLCSNTIVSTWTVTGKNAKCKRRQSIFSSNMGIFFFEICSYFISNKLIFIADKTATSDILYQHQ